MDDGTAALWRNVRPMPKDKLVWRPALEARKVRELLEELMITTDFTAEQLLTKKMPEMKWGEPSEARSIDQLAVSYAEATKKFLTAVEAFPESELLEMVEMPWGTLSYFQIVSYPYWNLMYHYDRLHTSKRCTEIRKCTNLADDPDW